MIKTQSSKIIKKIIQFIKKYKTWHNKPSIRP